jgi:hypothetical protein
MENNREREPRRSADDSPGAIGDPHEGVVDDPLGDEAAFPSTWQCLAGGEGYGRD